MDESLFEDRMDDRFPQPDHKADARPQVLDVRGLKCPLPALLARRALERGLSGQTLSVVADDPLAAVDVPHMCRQEGYEVLEILRDGEVAYMRLRKPK
jgi:tRNA 2-thiouridine synthesizing protein A